MRLMETHSKAVTVEPATAGWFSVASIIGAAFLLLAVLNATPV
jgi:hypothetical protein